MRVLWDEPKRLENLRNHSLDFGDAAERFEWTDAVVKASYKGSRGEDRYKAIGYLDGDLVALVFSRSAARLSP